MWRGSSRFGLSVSAPFVWWCPSNLAITPFPTPRIEQSTYGRRGHGLWAGVAVRLEIPLVGGSPLVDHAASLRARL